MDNRAEGEMNRISHNSSISINLNLSIYQQSTLVQSYYFNRQLYGRKSTDCAVNTREI